MDLSTKRTFLIKKFPILIFKNNEQTASEHEGRVGSDTLVSMQ